MSKESLHKDVFQSQRLRVARRAHGFTLSELGEKIGTSRQYISQLETGLSYPTVENIEKLSESLNVKADFFNQPISHPIDISEAHFRHRLTTPDSIKKEVLSKLIVFEEFVSVLDETFSMPEVVFPNFVVESIEDIERAAEKTRIALGVPLNKPVGNLSRLIEGSGGVIVSFSGHDKRLDALSVERTRPIFVILESDIKQSPARVRFDLAHELGHIVMHGGLETGDKKTETEANRFASAFLMPRTSFLNEFSEVIERFDWKHIYSMKIKWGVSVAAILKRLFDLNVIDKNLYKRGFIYLSKTGQRQKERYDDQVKVEEPSIVSKCLQLLEKSNLKKLQLHDKHMLNDVFISKVFGQKFEASAQQNAANDL